MNDHSETSTNMAIIALQARASQGISFEKRKTIQYAFPARYSTRKILGEVPGKPLTPYGVWAHYILVNNNVNSMVFVDGERVLNQNRANAVEAGLSVSPLLVFAEEPDVNNLEKSPDVSLSNLKIFYTKFTESQASKLYHEEIGTLSNSSEDNVHILYVHRVSEISDPNLLVECVARGPGQNMEPSINWFILAADGINYSQLNQSGLNHRVYTTSVSDNHRTMSALQLINYNGNSSIVCEAIDNMTGGRKASELKLSERSYNWTGWISLDAPHLQESSNGNKRFILIKEETCERPIDIECRTRYTHVPSDATGQVFDVDCSIEGGLVCSGSSQGSADNFTCLNAYEVRLLCPQQPIYWTRWFDEGYGSPGSDEEKFSIHKDVIDQPPCDFPLFAQCRVADTTTSWESTGVQLEYPYACTPEGLSCLDSDNVGNGGCQDFEVRYACPYPSVASPTEYWDLSGRLTVDGAEPTECGSHSHNILYSNTGGSSGSSSSEIQYTEAPEQLSQKCAVQTTSAGITLGNFDGQCLSKIGWCKNGMTVSVWIKQQNRVTSSNMVFFTSGGDESDSNGFAFVQKSSNKNYYVHFRSDGLYWNEIVLPEADIPIDEWFHVTLTFKDAIEGKLYIDGTLKAPTTASTIELNSRDEEDDFIIGSSQSSSDTADAAFSDVKFFDSVLTDEAVNGLYFCDETVTDPEVLSLTVESHHLNPELTIKCEVRGYPLTGVKWFMTSNITNPALVIPLEQPLPFAVITDDRAGCVMTSQFIAHDFATNFPDENVTFICSGEFNHNKDFTNVFVDLPNECERDVGFESGKIRPVQISSNVVLVFVAVPSLNGESPWVSTADDQSAYIEFDFGLRHKFAGLVVQGTLSSFISTYKVSYGDSPSGPLTSYHSNLNGGSESVWNSFNPEIESRIIRLRSLDTDGADEARVEFYGCPIEDPVLNLTELISSYNTTTNIYTLHCEGSYFLPPEVTWLADGQVISESRYDIGSPIEGVLTSSKELELKNFEVSDDEVVFTCVVAADGANITQNIQTEYAFTGQISVENTTEIRYLQSVSFECTVMGDDVYTMDWYFTNTTHTTPILLVNGTGVTTVGFTVGDSTGVFTLTVQSYGEDQDGTYQCSVNRATKQGNITAKADILLVVTTADPVYHQSNSSCILTCMVVYYGGYPSAIEWTLPNGTVISGSDSDGLYQVSETAGEATNVSELIVQGEYQNGTYTCTGRTAKEAWSDAVYVAEGESFEITSLSGNYNFTLLSYTAECVVSFVGPQPAVTWVTPDGGEITSGDSHVSNGYLTNVLAISSTDFSRYDGSYTCKVSSGDLMVEADISLQYAYDGELTLNVTQRFELGEDVKLTCTASEGDIVDEFTWSKVIDGSTSMPVVQDDIFKLSEETRQSSRSSFLEIAMFSRIDEGNYECSVNGGSKKIDLSVSALPGTTTGINCIRNCSRWRNGSTTVR